MIIDFDLETTGLQAYSGNNEAFLWIFSDGETHEAIPFSPSGAAIESWGIPETTLDDIDYLADKARIQAWFDKVNNDPDAKIRAWNARFDRSFAEQAGCFDIPGDGKWLDAMIVAHAIDERRSVALKAVAAQLFGEEAADPQKSLKAWLNTENRRRAKLLTDAEKAEAGVLKIKYEVDGKNKTRVATEEECAEVIAEAASVTDDRGDYVRANYSHVPQEIMLPYALEDVILTRKISEVYDPRVEAGDLQKVVDFEHECLDALYAIEKRGLPVKDQGVEYRKLEQEVIHNIERLQDRVMELAADADPVIYAKTLAADKWGRDGHFVEVSEDGSTVSYTGGAASLDDFNPKSSAQILACLKARGAEMDFMSQKDGKVSADADNLRAVNDELAGAILDFKAEFKVLSTYVRPMIDRSYVSTMNVYKEPFIAPDSKIHATYRQLGARTGRMSCADPNIQNQPRDDLRLRYNIVADPGYKLIACDLNNIEMVLFAAYCGHGRLLTAVQNGDDMHQLTADMLGLRDRARPGGGVETARQLGKVYNFTRIYGGGLRSIKRYFRCSQEQARIYKNRYMDAYPEVARLQTKIEWQLQDNGYIKDALVSGRTFRIDQRDSYKATNALVQGTAAGILKYAVNRLHEDKIEMVGCIHDEILAHVPEDEAEDAAKQIQLRMTEFEGLKGIVPLAADYDIIDRWSDAKPLKDDAGPYLFTPEWAGGERRRTAL